MPASSCCWQLGHPILLLLVLAGLLHDVLCHNTRPLFPAHRVRMLLDASGSTRLTANLTKFTSNGQSASVIISRPPSSTSTDDLIALYTHPSNPTLTVPIKWLNITALNPTYPATGKATTVFKLLNNRQNFILRLLDNGTFTPTVVAESRVITNTIPHAPTQVHLAQHADGRSLVVQWVSGSSQPQQLHFSTSHEGLKTTISNGISTSTNSSNRASKLGSSNVILSSSRTYLSDMMCGAPASTFGFMSPGYLHTAVIPGEAVGYSQRVHYKVGSHQAGWSNAFSVMSPPEPSAVASGNELFTFLVFNDVGQENAVLFNDTCPPYCPGGWQWLNYTSNSTKLMRHLMAEADARLGLLVGDLAYANGVQADWDVFGHQFEGPFSKWPLAVATGNHERDSPYTGDVLGNTSDDSGGECNIPYTYRYYTPAWEAADPYGHQGAARHKGTGGRSRALSTSTAAATATATATAASGSHSVQFPHPAALQPQHWKPNEPWQQQQQHQLLQNLPQWLNPYKSYYSFNMANVHFLMLDSESPSEPGSPQYKFVANDLEKLDRQSHPWLIVSLHRMMAGPTTDPINVGSMARLQRDYEELFMKFNVDLVLQGHEHAYARTCPLYKGKCMSSSRSAAAAADKALPGTAQYNIAVHGMNASSRSSHLQTVYDPGAPIYVLAGHAGAGFTHAFPLPLPKWVEFGVQDENGYLRVTVSGTSLTVVSISTDDGHVMDGVKILKSRRQQK